MVSLGGRAGESGSCSGEGQSMTALECANWTMTQSQTKGGGEKEREKHKHRCARAHREQRRGAGTVILTH